MINIQRHQYPLLHLLQMNSTPEVFELHFRKNLPRQITKCQGICGKKITPDDNGLLVRTYGPMTWTERGTGREISKYGPMYIHFSGRCLKAFDSKNYYGVNDTFDYQMIIVEKNVQAELKSGELEMLLKLDVKFALTNILTFILPSICVNEHIDFYTSIDLC